MSTEPSSIEKVSAGLGRVGYLPGESTALVSFLATRLGKPVLVEGPAGVGKTELAKALSRYLDRTLVRLQCYEGLDEAKALYEWNYRKQLLRIQAESEGTGWAAVQDDIFGEEFLLSRPLMQAIAAEEPVVLLIDEIDKTDQEFEALLLEVLSDFQITIPELGRVEARTRPVVLLTSNNTRELTEALKRRCLYLWLDYPSLEHELDIVRLHTPELDERVARKLVEVVQLVRELDLKKPPSIAESIDWARALLLLGADDIDQQTFRDTMSVIVKHRTDLDIVAEAAAVRQDVREEGGIDPGQAGELNLDALRAQIAAALRDGDDGAMRDLARLAIAAFGRQGEGSGVIGVDVQRIRRALGLRSEPQPDLPETDPRREGLPREQLRRFEALLRRELERAQI